jgi:hypothetical protein
VHLGLSAEILAQIKRWSTERNVTLRFSSEEKCVFDREIKRDVEESKSTWLRLGSRSLTSKIVTTISEFLWKFSVSYELFVFPGNSLGDKIVLTSRQAFCVIKTTSKESPRPEHTFRPPIDIELSWLLSHLDDNLSPQFKIARENKHCRTPRRNPEITDCFKFHSDFASFASTLKDVFVRDLFRLEKTSIDVSHADASDVFSPIAALFVSGHEEQDEADSVQFPARDQRILIQHGARLLKDKLVSVESIFPADSSLISRAEAKIVAISSYLLWTLQTFSDGIQSIEVMLQNQLVSALGKQVTSLDFFKYMLFHTRKVFREEYSPSPFCFSIRRPDHFPEGILSIEAILKDGSLPEPIQVQTKSFNSDLPMRFSIGAGTEISFKGTWHLHSWILHQFAGSSVEKVTLNARARQFSSFVLVVGKIASPTLFLPKCAILIKNKDDLKIPLLLEQIPTAKEFRDAIESLSEEQQDFAKAYRQMQLESTLFGLCILQIKPQLEKLIGIPEDSLTKEIQLTQDLMELFIDYQIPSDLLKCNDFDRSEESDGKSDQDWRISVVKHQVEAIKSVIREAKKNQLKEAAQELESARPDLFVKKSRLKGDLLTSGLDGDVPPQDVSKPHRDRSRTKALDQLKMSDKSKVFTQRSEGLVTDSRSTSKAFSAAPEPRLEMNASESKSIESEFQVVEHSDFDGMEGTVDFTKIPKKLDQSLDQLGSDNALRATIISLGETWTRTSQRALLASPAKQELDTKAQDQERDKTFDLLDALSRSGTLPFEDASLHVVIASTHCFEKQLVNLLVQDSINPIESLERSTLVTASVLQDKPIAEMIKTSELARIQSTSPILFALPASSLD